jgi:hypothetical protein
MLKMIRAHGHSILHSINFECFPNAALTLPREALNSDSAADEERTRRSQATVYILSTSAPDGVDKEL